MSHSKSFVPILGIDGIRSGPLARECIHRKWCKPQSPALLQGIEQCSIFEVIHSLGLHNAAYAGSWPLSNQSLFYPIACDEGHLQSRSRTRLINGLPRNKI